MNSRRPSHKRLLRQSGQVEQLVTRARQLGRLSRQFSQLLGAPLNKHCRLANYENQVLVFITNSSSWAGRLRYQLPALRQSFADLGVPVRDMRILVQPLEEMTKPKTPSRPRISGKAAKALKSAALTTEDPALRKAFLRLAERRGQPD